MKQEFTSKDPVSRRIHTLRDIDAQRLAAGEVIERPVSVVRELLENSIDAGSSLVQVHLQGGGLDLIKVIDNGRGMAREDLALALLPHTTSKIGTIEDLSRTKTLGFRGEALSSIAACSHIEMVSMADNNGTVFKVEAHNGNISPPQEWRGGAGTTVQVTSLFHSMPGRKKFLKRPQTEGNLCKTMVVEKSLSFPDIAFKLFMQDELKLFLPPSSLSDRVAGAYSSLFRPESLFQVSETGDDFSVTIVSCLPSMFRKDRKYIQVFVNNRRIQEYSLLQAVAYGFSGYLPGGLFPYSFLFIDIDPSLVDFNIHPTKKEVRFRNLAEIHHTVTTLLRSTLGERASGPVEVSETPPLILPEGREQYRFPRTSADKLQDLHEVRETIQKETFKSGKNTGLQPHVRYLGQAFDLFLIAQKGEALYFIDQHAAHERFLFDRFKADPPSKQELLIPLKLELELEESNVLEKKAADYGEMGIGLQRSSPVSWEITYIPSVWSSEKDTILKLLAAGAAGKNDVEKELFARLACRDAIKEGDHVDDVTARELIEYVCSLENPRCPHGRPIIYSLTKDQLYRGVERLF